MDDLEHALLSSGAIMPDPSRPLLSRPRLEELYDKDQSAWIIERAKGFKRPPGPGVMDRLVDGVKRGLGLGEPGPSKTLERDLIISAPGKVIVFGEHAVVHGVVSTTASTRSHADSRLQSPRH